MTKTKIALAAALFAATSSAAFAQGYYDPNIANRYPSYAEPNTYGYSGRRQAANDRTHAPAAHVPVRAGQPAEARQRPPAVRAGAAAARRRAAGQQRWRLLRGRSRIQRRSLRPRVVPVRGRQLTRLHSRRHDHVDQISRACRRLAGVGIGGVSIGTGGSGFRSDAHQPPGGLHPGGGVETSVGAVRLGPRRTGLERAAVQSPHPRQRRRHQLRWRLGGDLGRPMRSPEPAYPPPPVQ